MDDLQQAVARNLGAREAEAAEARVLVRQEVERFERWLTSLDVLPTISALRKRGDDIVEQVLRENESRWESLSPADRERLETMARAVVSRLLHDPTLRLKDSAGENDSYRYVHALRELFALELDSLGAEAEHAGGRGHAARAAPPLALRVIRLGTRGSALALAQAGLVAERLDDEVELVPITTTGDRRSRGPPLEDKSRFVKEIEEALLAGRDRPGGALRQGRAGRPARRAGDRGRARARRPARRALRRADTIAYLPRGRDRGHRQPAAPLAAARPAARTSTSATCAGTWTRACAGWPTGDFHAIVLARAGLDRLGRAGEGAPVAVGRAAARGGPGLPRARGARGRRARRASSPPRSPTATR